MQFTILGSGRIKNRKGSVSNFLQRVSNSFSIPDISRYSCPRFHNYCQNNDCKSFEAETTVILNFVMTSSNSIVNNGDYYDSFKSLITQKTEILKITNRKLIILSYPENQNNNNIK